MIYAYQETYVSSAQSTLGEAFDYAINTCNITGEDFIKLFLSSKICKRMENGEPTYLVGKSGIELVNDIIYETMQVKLEKEVPVTYSRSCEYWCGWAIAYFQWYSARIYSEIFQALSFSDLKRMYFTLHEADINKVLLIFQEKIDKTFPETNLKRLRSLCNYTQAQLAKKSGVSLRSIQMYEQKNKDINKATAISLYRLAKILGCKMEDLIEK